MKGRSAVAIVLGGAIALAAISSYEDMTAEKKQDYLWAKVMADTSSGKFMNPLKTIQKLLEPDNLWAMTKTHSDWRAPGHKKMTHGLGAVAKAHFEWKTNEYSGMFQQADNCVIRMANAAGPGGMSKAQYGPNLAVKCLRDGAESANMQFIWQIDGYDVIPKGAQQSCSYFETPLCNHDPDRDDINMPLKSVFIGAFQKIDPHSQYLGLSQMASGTQNGTSVKAPHFPFALVVKPAAGLNEVPCAYNEPISQLLNIERAGFVGKALYDIYAVRDPLKVPNTTGALEMIGSLVLDHSFTSSLYADTELFFRHTFFKDELELLKSLDDDRAAEWMAYLDDAENYKHEGANLYWPLLPGGPEEIAELARRPQMMESDIVVVV